MLASKILEASQEVIDCIVEYSADMYGIQSSKNLQYTTHEWMNEGREDGWKEGWEKRKWERKGGKEGIALPANKLLSLFKEILCGIFLIIYPSFLKFC